MSWNCLTAERKVRVGLVDNVKSITLKLEDFGDLYVQLRNSKIEKFKRIEKFEIVLLPSGKVKLVGVSKKDYYLPVILSASKNFVLKNKIYEGQLEIISQKSGFGVVNVLKLENYIYGVVPYEIDSDFTDEMIKVQAIIARTYAVANIGRHKNDGYDFCSTVHCQVYKGVSVDKMQRIKQLVDFTKGLVVVDDNDRPIQTYYHAACGGWIENVEEIWMGVNKISYLNKKRCGYCHKSPYYEWSFTIDKKKLGMLLSSSLDGANKIVDIRILDRTATGRAKLLEITTDKNVAAFSANKFREIVGYNRVKSTMFKEIRVLSNEIVINGYGWGHGVGLCQWGANYMTLMGKKFDQVIKFYYPGTKIKKYE